MLEVTSVRWDINNFDRAKKSTHDAAATGLFRAAQFLLEQANRTVPHEEGTLERSGTAKVDDAALEAALGYDTKYAIRQHEATHYRHNSGRRAKWLELTVREQASNVRQYLANAIGAVLE